MSQERFAKRCETSERTTHHQSLNNNRAVPNLSNTISPVASHTSCHKSLSRQRPGMKIECGIHGRRLGGHFPSNVDLFLIHRLSCVCHWTVRIECSRITSGPSERTVYDNHNCNVFIVPRAWWNLRPSLLLLKQMRQKQPFQKQRKALRLRIISLFFSGYASRVL